jgi:hypothetical protein
MTRSTGHIRFAAVLAAAMAVGTACTSAHADSDGTSQPSSNGAPASRQRVAIEERWKDGAPQGTFRLIPLSPGPVHADSGTFTFPSAPSTVTIRNGQTVTRFRGTDTLKGKRGTLTIVNVQAFTDAGDDYQAGAGTWSIDDSTGSYWSLEGDGRGTTVATPNGVVLTRYEGYVRAK